MIPVPVRNALEERLERKDGDIGLFPRYNGHQRVTTALFNSTCRGSLLLINESQDLRSSGFSPVTSQHEGDFEGTEGDWRRVGTGDANTRETGTDTSLWYGLGCDQSRCLQMTPETFYFVLRFIT